MGFVSLSAFSGLDVYQVLSFGSNSANADLLQLLTNFFKLPAVDQNSPNNTYIHHKFFYTSIYFGEIVLTC